MIFEENACGSLEPTIEMKTVTTLHHMHCIGACMLKLHIKDGKVRKLTSHGDIPREGSYEKDESLLPIQRRACLKGLAEINRIYAPDRLKYLLKQTAERGNIRGFKGISWNKALDTVAGWYTEMAKRKDDLGKRPWNKVLTGLENPSLHPNIPSLCLLDSGLDRCSNSPCFVSANELDFSVHNALGRQIGQDLMTKEV